MQRIETIVAFTQIDEIDEEGIIAFLGADGMWLPMIGADEARIRSLYPQAEETARLTGRPVRMLRFTGVELIDVIQP